MTIKIDPRTGMYVVPEMMDQAVPQPHNFRPSPQPQGQDTVRADLTPGEAVIPAPVAQDPRFQPMIKAMVNEGRNRNAMREGTMSVPGYTNGNAGVPRDFTQLHDIDLLPIIGPEADAEKRARGFVQQGSRWLPGGERSNIQAETIVEPVREKIESGQVVTPEDRSILNRATTIREEGTAVDKAAAEAGVIETRDVATKRKQDIDQLNADRAAAGLTPVERLPGEEVPVVPSVPEPAFTAEEIADTPTDQEYTQVNQLLKAGEEVAPTVEDGVWDNIVSGLGSLAKNIGAGLEWVGLDPQAITQATVLYLGARAAGYDERTSANFAVNQGLSFNQTLQANKAASEKAVIDHYKTNVSNYTPEATVAISQAIKNKDYDTARELMNDSNNLVPFAREGGQADQHDEWFVEDDILDNDGNVAIHEGQKLDLFTTTDGGLVTKQGVRIPRDKLTGYSERHSETSVGQRLIGNYKDQDRYSKIRVKAKDGSYVQNAKGGGDKRVNSQTDIKGLVNAYISANKDAYGHYRGVHYSGNSEGKARLDALVERALAYEENTGSPVKSWGAFIDANVLGVDMNNTLQVVGMDMANFETVAENVEQAVDTGGDNTLAVNQYSATIAGAVGSTDEEDKINKNLTPEDRVKRKAIRDSYAKLATEVAKDPESLPEGWNTYWYFVNEQAKAAKPRSK